MRSSTETPGVAAAAVEYRSATFFLTAEPGVRDAASCVRIMVCCRVVLEELRGRLWIDPREPVDARQVEEAVHVRQRRASYKVEPLRTI